MALPEPLARLGELAPENRVVTIGTFDGVHCGHQSLIEAAAARSRECGQPLTVITFDPVPAAVLRPAQFDGAILTRTSKVQLLRAAGADHVVVLPFTEALAALPARTFVEALWRHACMRELFVGEDFALGSNREGTVDVLTEIGAEHDIRVVALTRIEDNGVIISSSGIRRLIRAGDVQSAREMLGHPFMIEGDVIHGAHVGRTIGFPTANVLPPDGQVQLADGIYATMASLPGDVEPRPAMTYIGTRPALNTGRRLIETHLLDFDGDLYGQHIHVTFIDRLRADADFPSLEELVAQLRNDEAATRRVLEGAGLYHG